MDERADAGADERVVLLDDAGHAVGTADKYAVHHANTPLHLAFSSYVFDRRGRFLLTRRAESKTTWPGVWTNTCCGHPGPGEPLADAVARRLRTELGATATTIELVLPRFRYQAVMDGGIRENEMCPVYRVEIDGPLDLDPAEVVEVRWVDWQEFAADPPAVSPWCQWQVEELTALGPDPWQWPVADDTLMPPAARA